MHMSEVLFIWMTTNGLEMNVQIAFSLESIESIQTTDRVRRVVLLINGRFNYLSVPCWHRKEECERYYHYTESLIDLTRTWPLRIRKTISYDSIGRPIITHDLYQDSFLLSNGNCIPFVFRFSWWYFYLLSKRVNHYLGIFIENSFSSVQMGGSQRKWMGISGIEEGIMEIDEVRWTSMGIDWD